MVTGRLVVVTSSRLSLRGLSSQFSGGDGDRDGDHLAGLGSGREILGHSQIAVTMNIYTHVSDDNRREAMGHMDRLLRRRRTT